MEKYYVRNTQRTVPLTGGPPGTPGEIGPDWIEVHAGLYEDMGTARAQTLGFERKIEGGVEPIKFRAPRRVAPEVAILPDKEV